MSPKFSLSNHIDRAAFFIVQIAGKTIAVFIVFFFILLWIAAGFFVSFSTRWELFMGTVSSAVTILMVFLILKAQNKDSLSIQLKLNELVAANASASNRLVNVEGMTEDELQVIRKYYSRLGDFAVQRDKLQESHSIDEVHTDHAIGKEMEDELTQIKNLKKD